MARPIRWGTTIPEPEMNSEELYRRKLLELERRTQEIERDAYSQGFAQGEKDGFDYGQKSVQVIKSQLERIAQNMEALPAKILRGLSGLADPDQHQDSQTDREQGNPNLP